ncbi:hypothetical protein [Desulfotomaculum sp. 1211_IL3151]|uniref:hypothetical protein n=1 Tax=Desulfotomaculum sp. 1211_IL3151 TaxID=3084055 RepID=UPI002FD8F71E
MSHFTVAVFTKEGGKTVEELLSPYQENNMDDCPKEFLAFNDTTLEHQKEYEEEHMDQVRLADGTTFGKYDNRFWQPKPDDKSPFPSTVFTLPEGAEVIKLPHKEIYPSFEDFMKKYHEQEPDKETGRYGYWENPNKKWDWWQEGGRWSGGLLTKDGKRVDSAKLKDIDWDCMKKEDIDRARKNWQEAHEKNDALKYLIYGVQKDDTEESYVQRQAEFGTFAVLTPDGKWHEKGEMGWFGIHSTTPDDEQKWSNSYMENFINNADPELTITIVDCHI